jgi:ferredoxin/flavodoxin---NADP+ reductase
LERTASGAVRAVPTGEQDVIAAGLVVRSVGYQGRAVAGVPFDERRGIVPNIEGRVLSDGSPLPGVYTTGWIKRGASGVIGTNRKCAQETVAHLVADFAAGRLSAPVRSRGDLCSLVRDRQPQAVDLGGWRSIDAVERSAGVLIGSPRRKISTIPGLLTAAKANR